MDWTKNAIGLFTKIAGWTNPNFDFIVGYAGGDWTEQGINNWVLEPNENLKPIELQARAEGKPFVALWDFDVSYYSMNQIDAHDSTWPAVANDYPLQSLISALQYRDIDGLMIRMLNNYNRVGGKEMQQYIAFAAKKFVERANEWLYTHKGANKWTIVLTNDAFCRIDGAQESFYSWLKYPPFALGIEQRAVLKDSYPLETDGITSLVGNISTWKFWNYYWNSTRTIGLILYNGDKAGVRSFLGVDTIPTDPGTEPPVTDPALIARIEALEANVIAVGDRLSAVENSLGKLKTILFEWINS